MSVKTIISFNNYRQRHLGNSPARPDPLPSLAREGRNGFVIDDTENAEGIAAKIGLLLDRKVREKMGAEALRTARENTWEAAVNKVVAVYESMLQKDN